MAPTYPRRFHSFSSRQFSDPNGQKGDSMDVSSFISVKIFFQLFAGTFFIFFLGVSFWKFGECLRFFTRHKVLGGGKAADTRYARTWYGWVSLTRHEANKETCRRILAKVRKWTAWRSSKDNYRWVWWDPGQKELEKRYEDKRVLRWLPSFLRSYKCTSTDAIWNPGPLPASSAESKDEDMRESVIASEPYRQTLTSGKVQSLSRRIKFSNRRLHQRVSRSEVSPTRFESERDFEDQVPCDNSVREGKYPVRGPVPNRSSAFSSFSFRSLPRKKDISLRFKGHEPMSGRAASLPSIFRSWQGGYHTLSGSSSETDQDDEDKRFAEAVKVRRFSHKYQVWSARMQVQTCNLVDRKLQELQEPPGSPRTDLLASLSSDRSASVEMLQKLSRGVTGRSSLDPRNPRPTSPNQNSSKMQVAGIGGLHRNFEESSFNWNHEPPAFTSVKTVPLTRSRLRDTRDIRDWFSDSYAVESQKERERLNLQLQKVSRSLDLCRDSIHLGNLSDWEVQLMYNLNRKLEWLVNETDPGRKPFHFPTLANHWLNRKCWQVTDPASRINLDAQRQWGDPRFNVPYPEPAYRPKPKYPTRTRKRAYTPKIDSWRAAVNRQRRDNGTLGILRAVELLESSADEPPDGKVDTACWILRKPPQGFGMSSKQKNAFYGSGTGWQEKLGDWQKVGRGYRIHKTLHGSKTNRTRVKEIATGISRGCRITSSKFSKNRHFPGGD